MKSPHKKIPYRASALLLAALALLAALWYFPRFSNAATVTENVLTDGLNVSGNLRVGDGTPTVTLDGEDAYIEGTLEVDGAARFDGATTFVNATTWSGNLTVGDGTPNVTLDGGDAYIEGTLEVDGAARFDGTFTVNGQHNAGGDMLPSATAVSGFNTPDSTGAVGEYASLALDSSGFPVVAYYDSTNMDLKVMHCNDRNCAGGDETTTSVDTAGQVGFTTSIKLDSSGFPVISYRDVTNADLKIMHCNDANCAGADETTTSVDTTGNVGSYTSLALDSSGFPVVSYYDDGNADLKVMHCNDANCAGGDETITSVDTEGGVGQNTSMKLDSSGFPVISYYDVTNADLKVMHCNDANCAGGDETITSVDTAGNVGQYTSLALDSSGFPVVSYYDVTNADLKVMHCNDANCAGANETTTSPDTGNSTGAFSSMQLDSSGFPAIAFLYGTGSDLRIIHCYDANCATLMGGGYSIGTSSDYFGNVYGAALFGKVTTVAGFDLAESYAVRDETIEAGDIVSLDDRRDARDSQNARENLFVEKSNAKKHARAIGVVSTRPGITLSDWNSNDKYAQRPVALVGRVPVKVTNENGPIRIGDRITISSKAGIGMKADEGDEAVGMALENFYGTEEKTEGKILIFIL